MNSFPARAAAALAALWITTAAQAQDFPKRPLTMIVPFAAGGTSDVIARAVAESWYAQREALGFPLLKKG